MLTVEEYCRGLKSELDKFEDSLTIELNFDKGYLKNYNYEDFVKEAEKQGFTIKFARDLKSNYYRRKFGKTNTMFAFLDEDKI